MTPTRHSHRCVPCTGALFSQIGSWEDNPILSSLIGRDGIRLLGTVVPYEGFVHAVAYVPQRHYLSAFQTMAEAKEAVEQAVLLEVAPR